jgi:hypothetical protein
MKGHTGNIDGPESNIILSDCLNQAAIRAVRQVRIESTQTHFGSHTRSEVNFPLTLFFSLFSQNMMFVVWKTCLFNNSRVSSNSLILGTPIQAILIQFF